MKQFAATMVLLTASAGLALGACGPQTSTISISMSEYEFGPAAWEVPAGADVEMTLTNEGSLTHNWVLMPREDQIEPPYTREEQQQALAEFRLLAGETETFSFTAPSEPGEYPVLCTEGGHYTLGMVGTLVVE